MSGNDRLPTRSSKVPRSLPGASTTLSAINVGKPARWAIFDGMLIGYARVSTPDQKPDHQIDALVRAGVALGNIHVDIASGAKASRPELDLVMKLLRDGDTVKVTRLDRLGRSLLHLVTLGAVLAERGVGLHVVEQGIDTTTAEGRAMFGMLSVLAEYQRELIVANTRDGLAAARARGRVGGPASPSSRPRAPSSSTTPAPTPSRRSPPCSTCPAPPCTATSTPTASATGTPARAASATPRVIGSLMRVMSPLPRARTHGGAGRTGRRWSARRSRGRGNRRGLPPTR